MNKIFQRFGYLIAGICKVLFYFFIWPYIFCTINSPSNYKHYSVLTKDEDLEVIGRIIIGILALIIWWYDIARFFALL